MTEFSRPLRVAAGLSLGAFTLGSALACTPPPSGSPSSEESPSTRTSLANQQNLAADAAKLFKDTCLGVHGILRTNHGFVKARGDRLDVNVPESDEYSSGTVPFPGVMVQILRDGDVIFGVFKPDGSDATNPECDAGIDKSGNPDDGLAVGGRKFPRAAMAEEYISGNAEERSALLEEATSIVVSVPSYTEGNWALVVDGNGSLEGLPKTPDTIMINPNPKYEYERLSDVDAERARVALDALESIVAGR